MWKKSIVILLVFFIQNILFAQPAYHGLNLEKAKALLQQARKKDREAAELLDSMRNLRWGYEERLEDAARNDLSKKERLQLENDIKNLKKQEEVALKRRKEADERLREAEEMLTLSPDKLNKKITFIEKKEGKIEVDIPATTPQEITAKPKTDTENLDNQVVSNQEATKPKKKKEKSTKEKKEKKEKKDVDPTTDEAANIVANKEQNDGTLPPPPITEEPTKENLTPENQPIAQVEKKKAKKKETKKESKKTPKKEPIKEEEVTTQPQTVVQTTETATPIEGEKTEEKTEEKPTQNDDNQTITDDKIKEKKKKNNTKSSKSNVEYAKYDPLVDPSVNPPRPPCEVVFEGKDPFTGNYKKELKSQILFAHTEEFMRNALGTKEYITCKAQVTDVQGGYRYLNLTFTIASRDAQRSFGIVEKGSPIVFKLMNGTNITLMNTKTDLGLVNTNDNTTTYSLVMLVNKTDMRFIQNYELDMLRIAWSSGYEDYEILFTDVLQNLFQCVGK